MTKNEKVMHMYNESHNVKHYYAAIDDVGLWESEKIILTHYIKKNESLLDLGCGAGRTTINLYKLGYSNILGIDFSEKMIQSAIHYCSINNLNIPFLRCDVTNLRFKDSSFDSAFFSYNGLMCIPEQKNRLCALKEIHRVLKNDSTFIFTAHDREHSSKLKEYWEKKRKEYEADKKSQKDSYEFGDMWTYKDTGSAFIHFSTISEIVAVLNELNFKIISIVERGLISEEPASVKDFSGDTIFYICKITK